MSREWERDEVAVDLKKELDSIGKPRPDPFPGNEWWRGQYHETPRHPVFKTATSTTTAGMPMPEMGYTTCTANVAQSYTGDNINDLLNRDVG